MTAHFDEILLHLIGNAPYKGWSCWPLWIPLKIILLNYAPLLKLDVERCDYLDFEVSSYIKENTEE